MYQKTPVKSPNELDVYLFTRTVKNGVTCVPHVRHMSCHTRATRPRLLGIQRSVPQELQPPIFSFFRCSYCPDCSRSHHQGKCLLRFCSGECWGYSPNGPQPLQYNPGSEQTTESLSLLLHKHHQLIAQTLNLLKRNILKTAAMVRAKRQEQWSAGDNPPLLRAVHAKTVAEESWQPRSSTAAVPPASWLIPVRRHNQPTSLEAKNWDYIKSPLKSSLPQKDQSFI